jgi:hypothetical protein
MKPLLYSVKDAEATGIGWYRDGFNIAYYQNSRKSKHKIKLRLFFRKWNSGPRYEYHTTISSALFYGYWQSLIMWILWKLLFINL